MILIQNIFAYQSSFNCVFRCTVINHSPTCSCIEGFTGNPLQNCYPKQDCKKKISYFHPIRRINFLPIFLVSYLPPPKNACSPSPCGNGAICRDKNGVGSCTCKENYYGDPYIECRPECLSSSDCPLNKACNQKLHCENPCLNRDICGLGAYCEVVAHNPVCVCPAGQTGDPFIRCFVKESKRHNFLKHFNKKFQTWQFYFNGLITHS